MQHNLIETATINLPLISESGMKSSWQNLQPTNIKISFAKNQHFRKRVSLPSHINDTSNILQTIHRNTLQNSVSKTRKAQFLIFASSWETSASREVFWRSELRTDFIRYACLQYCPGLRALEYFRWNQFLFCYVLTGTGNLLDLWSFGRRLATAQVSVRIGKGRKILRLYYPYIDVFRVRYNCCF